MKRAIVTGANGFVGTALCHTLVKKGYKVIAIVRNQKSNVKGIDNVDNIEIRYCDLSEYRQLSKIIDGCGFDVFFHMAWNGTSGELRGSDEVQIKNIQYACDAVRACAELQCKRFVFASSIMEYEIIKFMETAGTPGINTLYSSAKVAADYMARTIAANLEIDYIRAVISNIYGPGEKSARLVNTSIRKMLRGEHCAYSEGKQLYDFIYIDDAAEAFVSVGEKGKANETYYIGSLNPRPLKEFLVDMKNQVDSGIEIGLGEIPFSGVTLKYNEFDIKAIKRDTGFEPHVTFSQGIRNTIQWIREEKE